MLNKHKIVIGRNILAYRTLKKLTQTELGDMVGITKGAISQIENGETSITMENLYKTAKALGVPVSLLVAENEFEPEDMELFASLAKTIKDKSKHYETIKTILKSNND